MPHSLQHPIALIMHIMSSNLYFGIDGVSPEPPHTFMSVTPGFTAPGHSPRQFLTPANAD